MKTHPPECSSIDQASGETPEHAGQEVGHFEDQPITPCYPTVAEQAEWSEVITLYDRQHFLTYARLLDADRDDVDWRDGVREILRKDPDKDPRQARRCWESHLERARWIATVGFQQAVDLARAQ